MTQKTSEVRIEPKEGSGIFAALSYLLGPVGAIIILLFKKYDRYVKFHAVQAMLFGVAYTIVTIILIIIVIGIAPPGIEAKIVWFGQAWVIGTLYGFAIFVLDLIFAWKAFKGEMFMLPFIGRQAAKVS